jgi:hypothetical protein
MNVWVVTRPRSARGHIGRVLCVYEDIEHARHDAAAAGDIVEIHEATMHESEKAISSTPQYSVYVPALKMAFSYTFK